MFTSQNGDFDIQKTHINGKGIYVITAGLTNNGVLGKTDIKAKIFKKNTITVDMFGNAFYRQYDYKMVTHARVFSLMPNFTITEKQSLFLTNSLRYLTNEFGYENMCSWEKIKLKTIQLPCMNGKIDFDFMESFIAELEEQRITEMEAQRIAEIEAYLKTTGLSNYELSDDELKALKNFENIEWGEYEFQKIFNRIEQGRRLKKEDQILGNIPFVMAGITNTGIVNYISNPVASFPKNSITIDIFGNTFYRNYAFGAGDDTGVYWNDRIEYTKYNMLFFAVSMQKALSEKFSYGNKLRSSRSHNFKMKLPNLNGKIDLNFIENLISAIQKLVIKDTVLYNDKKIAATKIIIKR